MTVSAEVQRRERIAVPMITAMYLGVPLLFLALAVLVEQQTSAERERGFDWIQVVPSAIMLAAGALLLRRRRYLPGKWPGGGAMFGAVGGFFVFGIIAVQAIGLEGQLFDTLSFGFAYAVPVFGGLCWLLGWSARRTLTTPVVADLADSGYTWTYPVRGARRVTISVDQQNLSILETYSVGSGDNSSTRTRGERVALAHLSEVGAVTVDGHGVVPSLPSSIQATVGTEPGPALVIPRGRGQWIVPLNEAAPIAHLIQRRITLARTT